MQMRRDRLPFFPLIIIVTIIVLLHQYHYLSDESSGTLSPVSTVMPNEKFKTLPNKYSSVMLLFGKTSFLRKQIHYLEMVSRTLFQNKSFRKTGSR